ncbi:Heparinase II/III family protein [Gluconacetobacter diazotrophicus PA1 5]|uniref:Heparinase n=2 Tax=Gluconacetobacter diazotrophicus TaxID=33996 RepID=A0A7W4FEL3_GLUDI|nr:heparinase II/III family protein [Gluconacetobacter diazotrophicus]ACI50417.1 Heparinase II/III family protein [Gluconacetobacter diazotrophicus PA1 5]MBB2156324.1 heparinase [Gluconacetobacter diazotrophicus]TWB08288.1 putative heparinase superfamily protein [Gluconacetobacter diazotrophicus]CAP56324.1 putative heparinase II/III-like [Gluconacetobacter diazotrophicus PA1 5]
MVLRRWSQDARLSLARLPSLAGLGRVPPQPVHAVRDLWPGDAASGARLLRGSLSHAGVTRPIGPGRWEDPSYPERFRACLHGFAWLRDLRAVGTDSARLQARALVDDWLSHPPSDPMVRDCAVTGTRLASWLGHYDFFAASADDGFRQRLMQRLLAEGRTIAALMPPESHDWRALAAFKGLLAAAIAMPDHSGFLVRFRRYIDAELERQILPDGCHIQRSPEIQFLVLRELAEMHAMLHAAQIAPPMALTLALDRMSPVLRAMRHGDGGLALFNGSHTGNVAMIETVLSQATRTRVVATAMPDGGFIRLQVGRSLLLVDAAPPPPPGFDEDAHAGTLSFEFSVARRRVIVNCGAGEGPEWRRALRESAAHSLLVLEDTSSSDFAPQGGILRRPVHVTAEQVAQDGAHWLDLSHDGYHAPFGASWRRRLYLGNGGEDLRGEEIVEGERQQSFVLRFHLHPSVGAEWDADAQIVILDVGGQIWKFRADGGKVAVEESVYCGGTTPERSRQLVVRVRPGDHADEDQAEDNQADTDQADKEPADEGRTDEDRAARDHADEDGPARNADTPDAAPPAKPVPQAESGERTRQVVRWALMQMEG